MIASNTALEISSLKIGFIHLGCPKNLVDTENMLGLLKTEGHRIVADEQEAELMLVNTCSFIDKAQKESVQHLVRLAERGKKIVITGCLAQKYREELLDLIPEAGAVVGTGDLQNIAEIVNRIKTGERLVEVTKKPTYLLEDDSKRMHITAGSYVYLKIAEGCDYQCAFCIIPSMRGEYRSRSMSSIVEDAKKYADKGVSELILIGQDTTNYGKKDGTSLSKLLRALNKIEGIKWIRFMYAYPSLVNNELTETIAECDKVVKYLDCPLQHMHPDILRRMKRPVMDHLEFIQKIRSQVPEIKIRTGLIAGFPGETEAHFEFLLETVKAARFDRLGVFEYSDVDGAFSRELDGKVPLKEINQRRKAIMEVQQEIALGKNRELIGKTLNVMVDSIDHDKNSFLGRTQWDAPEIDNQVIGKGYVMPGDIVPVTISSATPYDIKGEVFEG